MNAQTSTGKSGEDLVYNIEDKLPRILSAINAQAPAAASAQLAADQAYNPGYMQLTTDLYKQYAPQLNQIGNEINRTNTMYDAQTDSQLMSGIGGQNARSALALQKELDPQFYANQDLIGNKQQALLGSIDPTRLTTGELENVSRGLGRSGQSFLPGGLNAAASAMNFGNALSGKQDRFSQYLSNASNGLSALRSGVDGFGVASRRPQQSNAGQQQFGLTQGTGQNAYDAGNNFMSGVFGNQQTQYKSALDKTQQAGQIGGSWLGSIAGAFGG